MTRTALSNIFALAIASTCVAGLCHAEDCETVDREASIVQVLVDHSGGKVLKVDERTDENGCIELEIRILIDGTVKAVIIPGQKSA